MDGKVRGFGATLRKYGESAREYFNKLDKNKKIIYVSGAVLLLTVIIIVLVVSQPRYSSLYTNMSTQDAASVAAYLKDKKISYQLSDGGTTILVPDAQKYDIRLDLANNNLPKGNIVGFESFDTTHFGETQSEQKVRYIAALQGELERTISSIDGVSDVRVHIVEPDPALFAQDQKNATAAVLLKMKPGYSMQDSQVLGITKLVSGGVEGLKPENISVIDSQGNVLSDNLTTGTQSGGQLSTSQMQVKQNYQNQLQKSVQSMLENIVGPGKVVVRASADLNFDQVEINQESYGDKQLRSNQVTSESSSGGTGAQGQPGTSSNIPGYQQSTSGLGAGQYIKTDKTSNYEIDKTTTHRLVAPGQLNHLSISVIINGKGDAQQQKNVEDMVSSATGINPTQGDKVTVAYMPFDTSTADLVKKDEAASNLRSNLIIGGAVLLGLIVALLLFWFLRRYQDQEKIEYPGEGVPVKNLLAASKSGGEEVELSPEDKEKAQVLEQLRKMAHDKPNETIEVLRSWLSND